MLDYIIVGDGIAALFLYYFLNKKDKKVKIIANQHAHAASTASTGIINPITGRSYALTWMAEELLNFSESFYTELEKKLDLQFFHPRKIYREFEDVRSQNNWTNRSGEEAYSSFYTAHPEKLDEAIFESPKSGMEIKRSFWVNAKHLVEAYRKTLKEQDILETDTFQHDDLKIESDYVEWNNIKAQKIIFAEGYGVNQNPFFRALPFQYALGYTLTISAEMTDLERIVKKGLFFIPLGEMRYQIGSSFIRDQLTETDKDKSLNELIAKVQSVLKVPFKVLNHSVGIRTVVKDRRPILGSSPVNRSIYIFNGLGTKGYSLAPYFARHLADHLCNGRELIDEVNIMRFHGI